MAKYLDETGLQRVVDKTKALIGVQELAVTSSGLRIQGMDDGVYKLTTTQPAIVIYYDGLTNTTNKITIYGNGTAGLLTVTKYGSFTYWRIWAKNYEANNEFEGLFYGSTTANAQTTFGVKKIDTLVNSASSLGSASKPVYVSSGELTEGTNYAGGTAVTLNGTDKSGSTASLYAPTSAGTSGYFLQSNGSGAPTWASVAQNIVPFPTGNNSQFLRYKGTLSGMAWEQPDTTPTSGSAKVVTSGGVYNSLNNAGTVTAGSTQSDKLDYVKKYYVSSDKNTWYRIWASGWKECGGYFGRTSYNTYTITFPFPTNEGFTNAPLNVRLSHLNLTSSSTVQWNFYTVRDITTTSMKFDVAGDFDVDWYACGY